MEMKWEISGKGRNSPNYGYYMLLIIAAPGVRDHLSVREISTVVFFPASIGSMVGELPRATISQDSVCPLPFTNTASQV